jgi:hypothetical protein
MTPLEQEIIGIFTGKKNFDEGFKKNHRFCLPEEQVRADTADISVNFTEEQLKDALNNLSKMGFVEPGPKDTLCLRKLP